MIDTRRFIDTYKTTIESHFGKPLEACSNYEKYSALVRMITHTATNKRVQTEENIFQNQHKKVFYFSMEFLIGKLLDNYLYTVGIHDEAVAALEELGIDLQEMCDLEPEPGLGNGGLGRLAACFLDSMASLGIAGEGIGLRYPRCGFLYRAG